MTNKELLVAAKRQISGRGRWCKGQLAKTSDGSACEPHESRACSWCAEGALRLIAFGAGVSVYPALQLLSTVVGKEGNLFYKYNDSHTKKEVLSAFDRAIRIASRSRKPLT